MMQAKCPFKPKTSCFHIWWMGRRAAFNKEEISVNPYVHPRAPHYTRAWISGYESWAIDLGKE